MLVPSPSVATAATVAVRPSSLLVATPARAGPFRPSPEDTSTPATAPSAACPPTSLAPAAVTAGRRLPTSVAAASAAGYPPRFPFSATAAAAAALPVGAPPSPATVTASLNSRIPLTLDAALAAAEALSAAASPPPAAPSPTLAGTSPVSILDALGPQGRCWVLMDGAISLEKLAVVRGCARRVRASKACPIFNSQSAETVIALRDKAERGRWQVPVAEKGLVSKELRSCVDEVAARVAAGASPSESSAALGRPLPPRATLQRDDRRRRLVGGRRVGSSSALAHDYMPTWSRPASMSSCRLQLPPESSAAPRRAAPPGPPCHGLPAADASAHADCSTA